MHCFFNHLGGPDMSNQGSSELYVADLIQRAESLYYEAFDSNCYRRILLQYQSVQQEHPEAMKIAPAFLQIAYRGMYDALFVNLAKLYDSSRAYSTKNLLTDMRSNQHLFAEADTEHNAFIREINAEHITYELCTLICEARAIDADLEFARKIQSAVAIYDTLVN